MKRETLANYYNSLAWYNLLTGKFKASEAILRKGIKLDSSNLYFYTNLPPVLLLQGKYEQALELYKELRNKDFTPSSDYETFADVFLSDFEEFKKEGIIPKERQGDVDKIIGLLKMESVKKDISGK